jgi:hypothetical protein
MDTRCFSGIIHACIWDQYQTYLLVFAKCRYELSLYPRYHLDETSLLCRKQLPGKAIAMDVWQDYILVTCPPFDIYVFKVHVQGTLSPLKASKVQVSSIFLELCCTCLYICLIRAFGGTSSLHQDLMIRIMMPSWTYILVYCRQAF